MVVSLAGTLLWRNSQYALYLTSVSTFFFLIISYLALLNYKSRQGIAIRLLLLLPTLYLIVDLFYNLSYTSAVGQDLAVGFLGWWCLVQALDVGIISSLQGESPPRWCVPDWNKEESNRKDGSMPMNGSSKHSTLSLWTRTPITSRPAWAIKTNHIPLHWKLLPLPSRLSDQLVWILDVMLLRRPGTSPFWPQEMRALEWSQKRLVSAARVNKEAAKVNLAVTPFGYNETSLRDAILQMLLCICAGYCHGIHVTEARLEGFYNIDVYKQLIITFSVGILVAFPNDLVETIMFHILQQSPLHLPCTALTPLYRRVSTSKDLTTMWSSQWHQMYRKECIRMSKLLPFLQSSRAASVLKVFFFSAVMHAAIFARVKWRVENTASPLSFLRIMNLSGSYYLFLGQGLLVLLEVYFSSKFKSSKVYQRCKRNHLLSSIMSWLQSFWVYGSLTWMARWYIADIIPLMA